MTQSDISAGRAGPIFKILFVASRGRR